MRRKILYMSVLLLAFPIVASSTGFRTYKQWEETVTKAVSDASLPSRFCWLPMLLTDFNPEYSEDDAAGVWAITPPMAHKYGLVVTDSYDARVDVAFSTQAAVSYLKDLYTSYQGDVNKVLTRYLITVGKTQLSADPAGVVKSLDKLASDYSRFTEPEPIVLSQVKLAGSVQVQDICSLTGVGLAAFREWNPAVSAAADIIPCGALIMIPSDKVRTFTQSSQKLYASAAAKKPSETVALQRQKTAPVRTVTTTTATTKPAAPKVVYYKIKRGDTLTSIARRYSTTVANLKKWNNLRSDAIRDGQTLKIYR